MKENNRRQYDVLVAGGGLSGVAAAVAAAREGKQVILIEQYGFLGGMAASALVNPFMAYCSKNGEGEKFNWELLANTGLFADMIEELRKMGALHSNKMTFHEEYLKIILDRMVRKYGVKVLFHSFVAEAICEEGAVSSVTVVNKSGITRYFAKVYVDATGDADLAALAGCPFELGNEEGLTQPLTLCFRVGNVDTKVYAPVWGWYDGSYPGDSDACRDLVNAKYTEQKRKGLLRNQAEGVSTYASCIPGVIHFNSTRICEVNPLDTEAVSLAEMEGREQMLELFRFMKENAPGFENSSLLTAGSQIGVRESRRIKGDVVINEQDILSCRKFEDSVARGTYCIDIHSLKEGSSVGGMTDIPYNDYYTIPYRALLPQGCKNLIVAGRPISSTQLAHGAHRVMPICTCIGESAGIAAACACTEDGNFRKVTAERIQAKLEQFGALY